MTLVPKNGKNKKLHVGLQEPEPISRRTDYIDGQPVQVRVFAPGASSVPPDMNSHTYNAWRFTAQLKLAGVLRDLGLRSDQINGERRDQY